MARLSTTFKSNASSRRLGCPPFLSLLESNMRDEEHIKKQLLMVLFQQNVAGARNVSFKKRYLALARDIGAIHEGKEPTHSREVVDATSRTKVL